eukprot:6192007-Pleurochrysis_carterae.AAC.2
MHIFDLEPRVVIDVRVERLGCVGAEADRVGSVRGIPPPPFLVACAQLGGLEGQRRHELRSHVGGQCRQTRRVLRADALAEHVTDRQTRHRSASKTFGVRMCTERTGVSRLEHWLRVEALA